MKRWIVGAVAVVGLLAMAGFAGFMMVERTVKHEWTTDSPRALEAYEQAIEAMKKYYRLDAMQHLERALELDPGFAMARVNLAWLKSRGDTEHVLEVMRSVDLDTLTPRETMLVRYYMAHAEREHERAQQILDDYLAAHPDDPYALNAACDEAWVRLAWDRAERCYAQLIDQHPNWVEAHLRLGYMAMAEGRFEDAEQRFQAYRYVAPDQANPHDSLGELRMLRGRYDEARAAFEQALANKPDFCPSHVHLARLAVFEGRFDRARDAMEAMSVQPACEEETAAIGCYIEVLIGYTQGDFDAAWSANESCPEVARLSVLAHRVALLRGDEAAVLDIETGWRKQFEALTMVAPLEKRRFRSLALHFEGTRLIADGKLDAGVARLAEADSLTTYWGDGRWAFKMVNRLDWAGTLGLLGRAEKATALRAEIEAVNPRFADAFGRGSEALTELAASAISPRAP